MKKKILEIPIKRLNKILKILKNPEKKIGPTVHITGTNGKGSTLKYLEKVLSKQNYKINTFTSPHIIQWEERININRKKIPKSI